MSLPVAAAEALAAFSQCQGWEQRARLLMQWGERLPPLAAEEQTDAHRMHGCESGVWLVGERQGAHWRFRAASEARLIRGLLALLLVRVEGLTHAELAALDLPDWFNQLGLARQLSPSRSNGLNAVLQRMAELTRVDSDSDR
jgi:cysteine desulfuration protein SufE